VAVVAADPGGGDLGEGMMSKRKLELRCRDRDIKNTGVMGYTQEYHIRAELNRLARQVLKIRQEVERPAGPIDAGYKTALTDVLSLIREAKR